MTESDLDLIAEFNAAVGEGDLRSMWERVHPDVVWAHNLGVGSPEEGVYRGREDVLRLFDRIVEPWDYLHAVPKTIDTLEEGAYLVKGELRAKHRLSDTEIEAPYEQRLEIQDGLLLRGEMATGEIAFG